MNKNLKAFFLSKPLLGAAGVLAIYLLFGWFAVDPVAKRLLPWFAETRLDSRLSVARVDFDPLRLALTVDGLELSRSDGGKLAGWQRLHVDLQADSLFRFAWHLADIRLTQPFAELAIDKDGQFNWSALLAKLNQDSKPSSTLPRVVIDRLKIEQGRVRYAERNRSDPFEADMEPLALELGQFSTLPEDRGDYLLAASFDGIGGTLRWKGDLGVNPPVSSGAIELQGVKLAGLSRMLRQPAPPIAVSDGELHFRLDYDFAMLRERAQAYPRLRLRQVAIAIDNLAANLDPGLQLRLQHASATLPSVALELRSGPRLHLQPFDLQIKGLEGRFSDRLMLSAEQADMNGIDFDLAKMKLGLAAISLQQSVLRATGTDGGNAKRSGSKPESATTPARASIEQIRLTEASADLKARTAHASALALSKLQTELIVRADKSVNWMSALQAVGDGRSRAAPRAAPSTAEASPPWKASLDQLRLAKIKVHIEDQRQRSPVAIDIDDGGVELGPASLDLSKPVPVKASLGLRQGGQLAASGKVAPQPLKGELQLRLAGLQLKPFAPYLSELATLDLKGGLAGVHGKLSFDGSKAFSARFAGGFSVDKLDIDKEADREQFLSWDKVASDTLRLSLSPNRLHMDRLRIDGIKGQLIIHEDKSLNVQRLVRSPPAPDVAEPSGSAKDSFPVVIERISFSNGDLDFADLSLLPQFGTRVHDLEGVINGLSSDPAGTAQVELDGKVDDFGSARLRGAVQPFRATEFTDLRASFRNLEMNRLTPYSGKFAGRKIESGKLSIDLEYKVKSRQLVGENKVVINTLKLGERVDSKEAMNLPLDLAIAVLEDSNGVIDLDLPIKGSLDDPQFSYGKIIWKAIVNVLQKVVTAPFRALGKLLGMGAEQLEGIAFDPGSARLAPPEQEKLKTIAGALSGRPTLVLKVAPTTDAANDAAALRELKTRHDVLAEVGVPLKEGEQPGPLDLNNVKVQTAIGNLLKDRTGGKRALKMIDSARDYFRKSKPEDLPRYAAMLEQLKATVPVPDAELNGLAAERARTIRDYLSAGGLDAARVLAAEPVRVTGDGKSVQVKMTLDAAKRP